MKYGRQPYMKRTTMSVPEMRKMLGLGKTESYWLVKKGYFRTVIVNDRIRIFIDSFEEWYANQYHYRKVNGETPGKNLDNTMSIAEMAKKLGIPLSSAELLASRGVFIVKIYDGHRRIEKRSFERWYSSQLRYKKADGAAPGQNVTTGNVITPREMADMLGIPLRNTGYSLIARGVFESVLADGRRYIDKDSFELWYARQKHYKKVNDE